MKIMDVRWSVDTAGPSPFDNKRTELFLLGCKKAMLGNPCKNCFNSQTWNANKAIYTHDPKEMAININKYAPNKYITIGGGEPTDQLKDLITLCKDLKSFNFHIIIYTWRKLKETLKNNDQNVTISNKPLNIYIKELLQYVDIIIDGEYKEEERLWNGNKRDGLLSSIGSGNQIVWDIKNKMGFKMKDLIAIKLENNNLIYKIKEGAIKHDLSI